MLKLVVSPICRKIRVPVELVNLFYVHINIETMFTYLKRSFITSYWNGSNVTNKHGNRNTMKTEDPLTYGKNESPGGISPKFQ